MRAGDSLAAADIRYSRLCSQASQYPKGCVAAEVSVTGGD
jgi:hypothetical protein